MKKKRKITKAIIPAAGYGTRFLPATKAQPKEMMPVVDKPIIQYVVEEAVSAGITEIIIVTNWQKSSVENHFDYSFELEEKLKEAGKLKQLEEVRKIPELANFIYVRQKGTYGNGTPVYCSRHLIDEDENFAVLWGDEFIWSQPPRLKQMMDIYRRTGGAVISAVEIKRKKDLSRYGIADIVTSKNGLHRIKKIVEKPSPDKAPSSYAAHGAYILPHKILKILERLKPGKGGEIWLPEAIDNLIKSGYPVYACKVKNGKYYDTGNKLEYLKANIDFGLKNKELSDGLMEYLKEIIK